MLAEGRVTRYIGKSFFKDSEDARSSMGSEFSHAHLHSDTISKRLLLPGILEKTGRGY